MHLPVSSKDSLHFYRYLCTHVLIANRQFVVLIDIPIQDCMQHLSVYKIFTLDIPCGNFTAQCNVNTIILRVTQDETMAVEISQHQFSICEKANRQFAILMHLFNCLPTLHLASQPYTPRMQPVLPLDAHYKSGRLQVSAYLHQLLQMSGH